MQMYSAHLGQNFKNSFFKGNLIPTYQSHSAKQIDVFNGKFNTGKAVWRYTTALKN